MKLMWPVSPPSAIVESVEWSNAYYVQLDGCCIVNSHVLYHVLH